MMMALSTIAALMDRSYVAIAESSQPAFDDATSSTSLA
jgi:hypothetical protein